MTFPEEAGNKPVDERWHRFRERARRRAHDGLEEFAPGERTRFDLDDIEVDLGGRFNDDTYRMRMRPRGEVVDIRELADR